MSGDIAGLKPGQLRYTLLLNDGGGTRDDLMIGRSPLFGGSLYVIVNAGTKDLDWAHIESHLGGKAKLTRADDGAYIAYATLGDGPVDLVWGFDWFGNIDVIQEDEDWSRMFQGLASFSRLILHDRRATGVDDLLRPGPARVRVVVGRERDRHPGELDELLLEARDAPVREPRRRLPVERHVEEARPGAEAEGHLLADLATVEGQQVPQGRRAAVVAGDVRVPGHHDRVRSRRHPRHSRAKRSPSRAASGTRPAR